MSHTHARCQVISIGYGRHLFDTQNPELERMKLCAAETHHYDMVIFSRRRDGLSKKTINESLTLHPTTSRARVTMLCDAYRIAARIIEGANGPVVVTTQDPFETALVGLLLKYRYRVKLVVQEHGDFFGHPFWRTESVLNRGRFLWGVAMMRLADSVRVVSLRAKAHVTALGVSAVTVLPVSIDPAPFRLAVADGALRQRLGAEAFIFITVARLVPQKNLTLLIDAFTKVHKNYPQARLVIVGEGPLRQRLEKRILRQWGSLEAPVVLLPWSQSVASLMKASDVYVLSSNYEGWARVLIEAMVVGLPIVTTRVGCADEVVRDGRNGIVVSVNDIAAFSEAMERCISDRAFLSACRQANAEDQAHLPGIDGIGYGRAWVKTLLP